MDKIILPKILVMASHGVNGIERKIKQPFHIYVTLYLNLKSAIESDNLDQTIDYGNLYKEVKSFAENKQFNLLETLAGSIAEFIINANQRIQKVKVSVEKCRARIDNNIFPAIVEIERKRESTHILEEE